MGTSFHLFHLYHRYWHRSTRVVRLRFFRQCFSHLLDGIFLSQRQLQTSRQQRVLKHQIQIDFPINQRHRVLHASPRHLRVYRSLLTIGNSRICESDSSSFRVNMVDHILFACYARTGKWNKKIPMCVSYPSFLHISGLVRNCSMICSITYHFVLINTYPFVFLLIWTSLISYILI